MSLAYHEFVTSLALATALLLVAGGAWLGAVVYMTRREMGVLRGGLVEIGDTVGASTRTGEQRYNSLVTQCQELSVRVTQAVLRVGRAERAAAEPSVPRSAVLDSFLESRYASAVERASAALVLTRDPATQLEPLRFAPRASMPVSMIIDYFDCCYDSNFCWFACRRAPCMVRALLPTLRCRLLRRCEWVAFLPLPQRPRRVRCSRAGSGFLVHRRSRSWW